MRKYSKRGWEKRKEERKGYSEFYQKHVKNIKDNKINCEECGDRLIGDVSEVAHILPKQRFKSIACNDVNIIYLCGWNSKNNCHTKFDNSSIENMSIFYKVCELFKQLEEQVEEKLNWKDYEKFS